jgi:hypothetical protein
VLQQRLAPGGEDIRPAVAGQFNLREILGERLGSVVLDLLLGHFSHGGGSFGEIGDGEGSINRQIDMPDLT